VVRTPYTHHYPHTQCPQELPEPAEAEEAEEVEEVEEAEAPPHHPTREVFKVSHLPSSVATAPGAMPSYANSNATNN